MRPMLPRRVGTSRFRPGLNLESGLGLNLGPRVQLKRGMGLGAKLEAKRGLRLKAPPDGFASASPTMDPESQKMCGRESLSLSLRPSRRDRAPAWGWILCIGL